MLLAELRYSLRNLLKAPGFALTAIITLALGIGASTAVFTVVDSVILRPLSYKDSGKLVVVWERIKYLATEASPYTGVNPRHEAIWKERTNAFHQLCLLGVGTRGVSVGSDHPRLVGTIRAQPNFLNMLQVTPMMGRNFNPDDGVKGRDRIVIMTYSLWQSLFQSTPDVIGRTLRIGDVPFQIVGVLPKDFQFPKRNVLNSFPSKQAATSAPPVEILTPLAIDSNDYGWNGDYGNWITLGRLKSGISVRQAELDLNMIQQQIVKMMPAGQIEVSPDALLTYVQTMQDAMVGSSQTGLWILMAAVVGLVLIACVNLANAQLGRAASRQREAAVRSALGASTWHLIWSSLSECLILSAIGGCAGILLAFEMLASFRRYSPVDLPRMSEIQPNFTVLAFSIATIAGCALLFGMMPALQMLRVDPQRALQRNSVRTQGSRQSRQWRFGLIGFQVFACTALLLITGLLTKSLFGLLENDRGFETTNVVTAEVNLRTPSYDKDQQIIGFDDRLLSRLRTLPGVQSAALVSAMPLEGETWIEGLVRPDTRQKQTPMCNLRWVSPQYFGVVRNHLVAGRFFNESDEDADHVIISEASAKAAFPNEDPIGQKLKWRDKLFTIVGVVADARTNSLKSAPVNMMYLPYRTLPPSAAVFMARSSGNPEALISDVRRSVWAIDPTVTITRIKTLDSQVNDSLASERFQTFVLITFGVAALLMAMLGVYGILSYTVSGRIQEIGLRMALGATRQRIYWLTIVDAVIPVSAGLVVGLGTTTASGALLQNLLYAIKPTDASVATAVAMLLLLCAAAGAFLPARRAASVDPMQALRSQ